MHDHPAMPPAHDPRSTLLRTAHLLLAVLVAVSLTAACTAREAGRPAPAPSTSQAAGPITFDEDTAGHAEELAQVRTLDMCAVHDVAVAERITDATAASLRLTTGLSTCELVLGTESSTWHVELGYGSRLTTGWTTTELAGTELRKKPDESTVCEYLVPSTDAVGLTIRAGSTQAGSRSQSATVCRAVERYLAEALLPRWNDPPTLADGLTTPRIPLLGKDPCAALAAAVADLPDERGRDASYSMSNPYSCQGASGSPISPYTVEFEVFSTVLDLHGPPVQIGDFTAYTSDGIGVGSCSYQIPVQPELVFSATEGTVYHAGIVVGLPTCDDTTMVEKVIADLIAQPDAPPARPDAQLIGDLDGP